MKDARNAFLMLLYLLIVSLVSSCGGGTSGTGDAGTISVKRFSGEVKDVSRLPLAGIILKNLFNGDEVQTDEQGRFSFETTTRGTVAEFQIVGPNFDSEITVEGIGEDILEVTFEVEVDQSAGNVRIVSLSLTPVLQPTPDDGITQEHKIEWEGRLVSTKGKNIRGARISILPVRETSSTDSQGKFRIQSALQRSAYSIRVQVSGLDETVRVGALPQGRNLRVSITLEVELPEIGGPVPGPIPGPTPNIPPLQIADLRVSQD